LLLIHLAGNGDEQETKGDEGPGHRCRLSLYPTLRDRVIGRERLIGDNLLVVLIQVLRVLDSVELHVHARQIYGHYAVGAPGPDSGQLATSR
jgi:hypothetical protein